MGLLGLAEFRKFNQHKIQIQFCINANVNIVHMWNGMKAGMRYHIDVVAFVSWTYCSIDTHKSKNKLHGKTPFSEIYAYLSCKEHFRILHWAQLPCCTYCAVCTKTIGANEATCHLNTIIRGSSSNAAHFTIIFICFGITFRTIKIVAFGPSFSNSHTMRPISRTYQNKIRICEYFACLNALRLLKAMHIRSHSVEGLSWVSQPYFLPLWAPWKCGTTCIVIESAIIIGTVGWYILLSWTWELWQ